MNAHANAMVERQMTGRRSDCAELGCLLPVVLNNTLAGVLILDARTHRIVDANSYAVEMIGLPKDQIVGRVCHAFICPAQQGACPIREAAQTMDRTEHVLLKADGTQVPILKTVVAVAGAGADYLVESFVDISRLQGAEKEARESLSLLEAAFESTETALQVVDSLGNVTYHNRQFQELWRFPDEIVREADHRKTLEYAAAGVKNPQAFLAGVQRLYGHPDLAGFDILELADGRILERCSKPQRLGDRVIGRVWSFRDITEKHAAEQKQAALLRRVAEINEELTHFAYVVSHDLKAPLRGITLIAEWLCADYADKLGPEAREQLDLLQSRVARMHNLIDGVLQYSRVGRIKEDNVAVDLNELIPGIIDGIAAPAHIRIEVQPGLPVIKGEKTRITQVFQNLLSNAVKFMDKPAGLVKIGCLQEGRFWRFHVADNGPGIEEKYFDRIFKLFQTLAPRDEFESTGVGLAMVKKIVEMYGGRIWVESKVGAGSTFLFTLPVRCKAVVSESSTVGASC